MYIYICTHICIYIYTHTHLYVRYLWKVPFCLLQCACASQQPSLKLELNPSLPRSTLVQEIFAVAIGPRPL